PWALAVETGKAEMPSAKTAAIKANRPPCRTRETIGVLLSVVDASPYAPGALSYRDTARAPRQVVGRPHLSFYGPRSAIGRMSQPMVAERGDFRCTFPRFLGRWTVSGEWHEVTIASRGAAIRK